MFVPGMDKLEANEGISLEPVHRGPGRQDEQIIVIEVDLQFGTASGDTRSALKEEANLRSLTRGKDVAGFRVQLRMRFDEHLQ